MLYNTAEARDSQPLPILWFSFYIGTGTIEAK